MSWLESYSTEAVRTDQLSTDGNHLAILTAGLVGEAGGILAEVKKKRRERDAYPAYRGRLVEEFGDFLWYFVRIAALTAPGAALDTAGAAPTGSTEHSPNESLALSLELGAAVGGVVKAVSGGATCLNDEVPEVWRRLVALAGSTQVDLRSAATENLAKTQSRWPESKEYGVLFDDDYPEEDRLPRRLRVEYRELDRGGRPVVVLRCNGLNFGDRLTDNIEDADFYRYHDVFHFAYAVHLGWSPVIRHLLRCKRKSDPRVDEVQDGARARIIEEAISAAAFARAKHMNLFDGKDHVDFDLLKIIREFTLGFEVEALPYWQWEIAILEGFRVFRSLRDNRGGHVELDLAARKLHYVAPARTAS